MVKKKTVKKAVKQAAKKAVKKFSQKRFDNVKNRVFNLSQPEQMRRSMTAAYKNTKTFGIGVGP